MLKGSEFVVKGFGLNQVMAVIHEQTVETSDVTIEHLKNKIPMVVLVKDGNEFEAQVSFPDLDHIRVQTNLAISFIAYIY